MDSKRIAASGSIGLTGVGLGVVFARHLAGGVEGVAGFALVGFGLLIAVTFVVGAVAVYRSDIRTKHLGRVAGWNLFGVVVTTGVLALVGVYQDATGAVITAPAFSGGVVVGVSAVAHVLIGVNDVRRIRAREVADQREKSAVVNRVIRHNLKHTAQVLMGLGERISTATDPDSTAAELGEEVQMVGSELGTVDDQVETITELVETETVEREPVDVAERVELVLPELRTSFPEAMVTVSTDGDTRALAGDTVDVALLEVLHNALAYGGDPATVAVRIEGDGDTVRVTVEDDGPGVPETERELLAGDRLETQLEHSSGLGLWLTKWIVEAYGGTVSFPDPDGEGGTVVLAFDAA